LLRIGTISGLDYYSDLARFVYLDLARPGYLDLARSVYLDLARSVYLARVAGLARSGCAFLPSVIYYLIG